MIRLLAAFVVIGFASSVQAQTPAINDAAKAMIGAWELSDAARDKVCAVTFSPSAVEVGYRIVFAPECAALFPLVSTVAGWRYPDDDLLYWLDAQGKALVQFGEVEDGIFEAPTPGVGVLFLHNPALIEAEGSGQPQGAEVPPGDERPELPEAPAPKNTPAPKNNGG